MAEDAITDEVWTQTLKASASGRVIQGRRKAPSDPRLQLGEVLPLRREDFDGETLQVRRTAHEGRILEGEDRHGEPDAGRVVPVPATLAWMFEAQINLNGPDCQLLFPTPAAASGASATSTATSGSQPRRRPA